MKKHLEVKSLLQTELVSIGRHINKQSGLTGQCFVNPSERFENFIFVILQPTDLFKHFCMFFINEHLAHQRFSIRKLFQIAEERAEGLSITPCNITYSLS